MQLIFNSEVEFPLFEAVQSRASCSSTSATRTTSRGEVLLVDQLARTSPTVRPVLPVPDASSNLRKSVGFGFRWISPIGPLRFEWGIPLDQQIGEDRSSSSSRSVTSSKLDYCSSTSHKKRPEMKELHMTRSIFAFRYRLHARRKLCRPRRAGGDKIAFVDLQRALEETKDGKAAKARLKSRLRQEAEGARRQAGRAQEDEGGVRQEGGADEAGSAAEGAGRICRSASCSCRRPTRACRRTWRQKEQEATRGILAKLTRVVQKIAEREHFVDGARAQLVGGLGPAVARHHQRSHPHVQLGAAGAKK